MHRLIIAIILTISPAIALGSGENIAIQAKKDAKSLSDKGQIAYLECYPNSQEAKEVCVNKLNNVYITNSKLANNSIYAQNFQYEAEKLGFLKFLRHENKNCIGIDKGPIYENAKNAYKVECICAHEYYMSYDYKTKQWKIID